MIKLTDFKFFANTDGELYVSVADLKKRLKEEYQGKTNYDRIRNMSVEEMAKYLQKLSYDDGCEKCCAYTQNGCCNKFTFGGPDDCVDGVKQWLESEVSE